MNIRFFWFSLSSLALVLGCAGFWVESEIQLWLNLQESNEISEKEELFQQLTGPNATQEELQARLQTFQKATAKNRFILFDENGEIQGEAKGTLSNAEKTLRTLDPAEFGEIVAQGKGEKKLQLAGASWRIRDTVLSRAEGPPLILRVAYNETPRLQSLSRARVIICLFVLFLFSMAILLTRVGSFYTYKNLRRMLEEVRPIAKALASKRGVQTNREELATIAKSIRTMASDMEEMVSVLAEERNRFSTVLESMNTGVLSLDPQKNIIMANPAAHRILSTKGSLVGVSLGDILGTPEIHELLQKVRENGSSVSDIEFLNPGRRVLRIQGTTSEASGTLVLVMDEITQLRTLEVIRKDFVANVSHELRTPVSVIQANAETLLGGAMSDEKSGPIFLEAIMRNAKRLGQLITDLLDLAQLESGNYRIEIERIHLASPLGQIIKGYEDRALSKSMQITTDFDPNDSVWGDTRALNHVVGNYLENAIKYTPDGGTISLRTVRTPGAIRIEVEDNGPGIEPRHHTRLFERFYRVDTGRSRELGGTGLGLAIVKHLTLSMGGRVGMELAHPHGSIFWFDLPDGSQEDRTLIDDKGENE